MLLCSTSLTHIYIHTIVVHIYLLSRVSVVSLKSLTVILKLCSYGLNPSLVDSAVTGAAEAGLFHSVVM